MVSPTVTTGIVDVSTKPYAIAYNEGRKLLVSNPILGLGVYVPTHECGVGCLEDTCLLEWKAQYAYNIVLHLSSCRLPIGHVGVARSESFGTALEKADCVLPEATEEALAGLVRAAFWSESCWRTHLVLVDRRSRRNSSWCWSG
jgi:hypothetical protein